MHLLVASDSKGQDFSSTIQGAITTIFTEQEWIDSYRPWSVKNKCQVDSVTSVSLVSIDTLFHKDGEVEPVIEGPRLIIVQHKGLFRVVFWEESVTSEQLVFSTEVQHEKLKLYVFRYVFHNGDAMDIFIDPINNRAFRSHPFEREYEIVYSSLNLDKLSFLFRYLNERELNEGELYKL